MQIRSLHFGQGVADGLFRLGHTFVVRKAGPLAFEVMDIPCLVVGIPCLVVGIPCRFVDIHLA